MLRNWSTRLAEFSAKFQRCRFLGIFWDAFNLFCKVKKPHFVEKIHQARPHFTSIEQKSAPLLSIFLFMQNMVIYGSRESCSQKIMWTSAMPVLCYGSRTFFFQFFTHIYCPICQRFLDQTHKPRTFFRQTFSDAISITIWFRGAVA